MTTGAMRRRSSSGTWRLLMEMGVFDDSYPHRLNSCFQFLSADSEDGCFTLKDLIQKSTVVFPYLSLDIAQDSSFAVMDLFRNFDRSGKGHVNLEDFALGVAEKILALRKDTATLERIAAGLLNVESRCTELATMLEKGNTSSNFAKFNANLKAFSFPIRTLIRQCKVRENLSALDAPVLIRCFQNALAQAALDTQVCFHLSTNRLSGWQLDDAKIEPAKTAWCLSTNAAGEFLLTTGSDGPKEADEAEEGISHLLSANDEGLLKRRSMFDVGHVSQFVGRPQDLMSLLEDLRESLPLDVEKIIGKSVAHDSTQLHLLQDALLSLNSFFQLRAIGQIVEEDLPLVQENRARNKQDNKDKAKQDKNQAQILEKLQEYRKILNPDLENPVDPDAAIIEAVLAEKLVSTQDVLTKVKTRLSIMEMIQSDLILETADPSAAFSGVAGAGSAGTSAVSALQDLQGSDLDQHQPLALDPSTERMWEGEPITFEKIMQEISLLGANLAERSSNRYPLGLLMEQPLLLMDKDKHDSLFSTKAVLQSMEGSVKEIGDELRKKQEAILQKEAVVQNLEQQEQKFAYGSTAVEQAEFERNEFMALAVEMQVMREKNQKISKDELQVKMMESRNAELSKRVKELEDMVQHLQQLKSQTMAGAASRGLDGGKASSSSAATAGGSSFVDTAEFQQLQKTVQELSKKCEEKEASAEQIGKENQRLKASVKISEQRVKSALQDQMTLHQQIQVLEEESMQAKATITKLTRELEEQRTLRSYREEAERKIFELNKEVSKREVEATEAKENASLANKYHADLIVAERAIESLEQKISEYAVELEKGNVAINQLESYREQVRAKTKEIRDLSIHIHALETQMKDVAYLQSRIQEVSEELHDYKVKAEKIPGLLAEISRLRGSTRASIKALAEQDKLLSHMKGRVKQLEKENALLKNDNRGLQDAEIKLRDANAEIKRLMGQVSELNALKAAARNAEEEKKASDGQYKKMRKFMQQTALVQSSADPYTTGDTG